MAKRKPAGWWSVTEKDAREFARRSQEVDSAELEARENAKLEKLDNEECRQPFDYSDRSGSGIPFQLQRPTWEELWASLPVPPHTIREWFSPRTLSRDNAERIPGLFQQAMGGFMDGCRALNQKLRAIGAASGSNEEIIELCREVKAMVEDQRLDCVLLGQYFELLKRGLGQEDMARKAKPFVGGQIRGSQSQQDDKQQRIEEARRVAAIVAPRYKGPARTKDSIAAGAADELNRLRMAKGRRGGPFDIEWVTSTVRGYLKGWSIPTAE